MRCVDPAHQREVLPRHAGDEYQATLANPYVAAERGYVDRVIFPHETRFMVVRGLRALRNKRGNRLPRKHGNIPL